MNSWKDKIFYEIYVPSWPSLQAIASKFQYLQTLGITGIWLTPFYPSPGVDNGYNVSDYCKVDPIYGNLTNFDKLVRSAHELGISVIIDLVLNHTSTEHYWFLRHPDWYIWRDEPNNWKSFFGGSAWEFDKTRRQYYYYHSFAREQADLNWRNPAVKSAMFEVIDFWKAHDVDGFRLDVINNLTTSSNFPDNPSDAGGKQIHLYDVNQSGVRTVISELKQHIGGERFTVGEISSDQLEVISQYVDILDAVFNFNLGSIKKLEMGRIFAELKAMQELEQPTLFFNSHDISRSMTRLAAGDRDTYCQLAALMLLNHGIPFLYQGEELGLSDFIAKNADEIRDIQALNKFKETGSLDEANAVSRDRSRYPIDWNSGNLEILDCYRTLIRLHQNATLENLDLVDGLISYSVNHLKIYLNFSSQPKVLAGHPLFSRLYESGKLLPKGIFIEN